MAAAAAVSTGSLAAGEPAAAVAAAGRVFVGTLAAPDPRTSLSPARLTGVKAVAVRAVPLAPLKAAAARLPGRPTLNDLAAAALAGAVRAHLGAGAAGAPRLPPQLHVGMPFSLHPPATAPPPPPPDGAPFPPPTPPGLLGNRFALLAAPLPVGEATPAGRLAATTGAYRALKRGCEPALTAAAFSLLGALPCRLRAAAWARLTRRVSLTFSNVPGPTRRVRVGGRRVAGVAFLVPTAGRVGASVGVFSYAGTLTVGVYGDATALGGGGAAALADGLVAELDALVAMAAAGGGAAAAAAAATRRAAAADPRGAPAGATAGGGGGGAPVGARGRLRHRRPAAAARCVVGLLGVHLWGAA